MVLYSFKPITYFVFIHDVIILEILYWPKNYCCRKLTHLTRVQIVDEAVCISHIANNLKIFSPDMSK